MSNKSTQFSKTNQPEKRGRPKGSKSRTTEEIRGFIQRIVDKNLENLESDLDKMNPTNRWVIIDKLTKYFLPALTKNDNNNVNSGDVTIRVEYTEPKKGDKEDEKKLG